MRKARCSELCPPSDAELAAQSTSVLMPFLRQKATLVHSVQVQSRSRKALHSPGKNHFSPFSPCFSQTLIRKDSDVSRPSRETLHAHMCGRGPKVVDCWTEPLFVPGKPALFPHGLGVDCRGLRGLPPVAGAAIGGREGAPVAVSADRGANSILRLDARPPTAHTDWTKLFFSQRNTAQVACWPNSKNIHRNRSVPPVGRGTSSRNAAKNPQIQESEVIEK
jgi:hypothetical protein